MIIFNFRCSIEKCLPVVESVSEGFFISIESYESICLWCASVICPAGSCCIVTCCFIGSFTCQMMIAVTGVIVFKCDKNQIHCLKPVKCWLKSNRYIMKSSNTHYILLFATFAVILKLISVWLLWGLSQNYLIQL